MNSAGCRDVVISASSGPVVSLVGSSALPNPPGDVAPLPVDALKDIRTVRTGWFSGFCRTLYRRALRENR